MYRVTLTTNSDFSQVTSTKQVASEASYVEYYRIEALKRRIHRRVLIDKKNKKEYDEDEKDEEKDEEVRRKRVFPLRQS